MKLSAEQSVAILLMNRRKKRVERAQLTPGPRFYEDRGDLAAMTESEDWGDLMGATEWLDWNWS
jgi:hypothetical protein